MRSLRRLRAAQKVVLGERVPAAMSSLTAPRCRRPSRRCRSMWGMSPPDSTADSTGSSRRSRRRSPTGRSCGTTPTTSSPGQQSMSIALLDDEPLGGGDLVHPPPRPGARVRKAGDRGRPSCELSPGGGGGRERRRLVALRGARRRVPPANPPDAPPARRVPRAGGTFSEEALLGALTPPPRPVPSDDPRGGHGGAGRAVEWSLVPIENSVEGSVTVTLDTLAGEAEEWRSWARWCSPYATI